MLSGITVNVVVETALAGITTINNDVMTAIEKEKDIDFLNSFFINSLPFSVSIESTFGSFKHFGIYVHICA
jgi:hypothetical protein